MRIKPWVGALMMAWVMSGNATPPSKNRLFIPEASGVCRVGDSIVVASDEDSNALWMVDRDLVTATRIKIKGAKWDDVEDLTPVDDRRFFVMTSHARTKSGKRKPEREQLLLLTKSGDKVEVSRSWSLREAIISALEKHVSDEIELETVESQSPESGGLNAEGAVYHGGAIYIGLRSPITTRSEGLLLKIANAKAMLEGATPQINEVYRLPLVKRGIRGLTAQGTELLVLAGTPDDTDKTFSLFRWSQTAKQPQGMTWPGFDRLLRPEGISLEKTGSLLVVQDFEEPNEHDVISRLETR